jgi:hypothetical protein
MGLAKARSDATHKCQGDAFTRLSQPNMPKAHCRGQRRNNSAVQQIKASAVHKASSSAVQHFSSSAVQQVSSHGMKLF